MRALKDDQVYEQDGTSMLMTESVAEKMKKLTNSNFDTGSSPSPFSFLFPEAL